ncbi:MAG: NACHT domain-containing protein, partial [Anaerolineales bacterium]
MLLCTWCLLNIGGLFYHKGVAIHMAHLAIRVLGPFEVSLDGQLVSHFETQKSRALLAYLVASGNRTHHRENLAEMLWPDRPEGANRANLRHTLRSLRQSISDYEVSPPYILSTHISIALNPDGDVWVDIDEFMKSVEESRGCDYHQVQHLEELIRLYRGVFLQGLSLDDSTEFEEWVILKREQVNRQMLHFLYRLTECYEYLGDLEHALEHAWHLVELDPWDETGHQKVMRLLALSGRRAEALAQYESFRHQLAKELGVTPISETEQLYVQIRDGFLSGSLSSSPQKVGLVHNLPLTSGPFIGREVETGEIQEFLQNPACRLLTLVGPGGIGKTRLVLETLSEWLSRQTEKEFDGVTYVSLIPLHTVEAIVPAITQAIGFHLSPGRDHRQQLMEYLGQKRWLLILDSFEHLPDGVGFVSDVLRATPHVKILVTSRTRLNLQEEFCYPVNGLRYSEEIHGDIECVRDYASVKLFMQASHQVFPRYVPAETDLIEIAHICRLVQGIPLYILLAAAWIAVLNPAEIAGEIGKNFDFMKADWPDIPDRQRSLRAVFDYSWYLLSRREQELFLALCVFSGGFTRGAAQNVGGASLHELKALADKSMLQCMPSGRYNIHDLLQQYGRSKCDAQSELCTTSRDRHCAYYMTALHHWEAELDGSGQQKAMTQMEVEIENIRAAWQWAVEHAQVERLGKAMEGLVHFFWHSGRGTEAVAAFQGAATAATAAVEHTDDPIGCMRVWVRALTWQSDSLRSMDQRDDAIQLQQRCLTLLRHPILINEDTSLERA